MEIKSMLIWQGVLFFVFFSNFAGADTPKLWDKTIGGSNGDTSYGVAVDSNNNIIVVGYTNSFGVGNWDVWTIKYDSNGNLLWNRTIGGSVSDQGYGVAIDSNNNIIVVGITSSFGAGNNDIWTIKYNADGTQLWNKTIGGSSSDYGNGVAIDSNNNIIVAGYTYSFGAGSSDLWVIQYDSNGNQLWNKTIGGSSLELGSGVAIDSNNNIIVTGTTYSFGAGSGDVWTIKYNSSGSQLWNRTIGGSGDDESYGVAIDSNNNIIVVGYTSTFGSGGYDIWVIKYNSNGSQLWNRTIGGSNNDLGSSVAVDSNNNIIVAGRTSSFSVGYNDVWTIKYDSNGNQLWNRTIGGGGDDYGQGVAIDSNNNIIVAGYTSSFGAGGADVWTIKYGTPICDDGMDNDRNGATDCDDLECTETDFCITKKKTVELWSKSFTPQPTIVTLQGRLTNTSGDVVNTASMQVTISNSTGQVWNDTFNNTLNSGVFNIPLGASKELSLVKGNIYTMKVEIDVDSTTFVAADVTFGDNLPVGDVIKFTA